MIKVSVNEKGEGEIKPSYSSYKEIEQSIVLQDGPKVNGYMIEAGLASDDIPGLYGLIELCIMSSNSDVRVLQFKCP